MNPQNLDYLKYARSELFKEYFTLTQIVHKYDDYCLQIKILGVIISFATIGYGAYTESALVFFSASVLSLSFWLTEAFFKVLQQDHMLRLLELERQLSGNAKKQRPYPRLFRALRKRKKFNRERKYWRKAMVFDHVMYPHVVFTMFGLMAGNILIWRSFLA